MARLSFFVRRRGTTDCADIADVLHVCRAGARRSQGCGIGIRDTRFGIRDSLVMGAGAPASSERVVRSITHPESWISMPPFKTVEPAIGRQTFACWVLDNRMIIRYSDIRTIDRKNSV